MNSPSEAFPISPERHQHTEITHRSATAEDARAMVLLEAQAEARRQNQPIPQKVTRPEATRQFEGLLQQDTTWSRMALEGETPIGFIIGCPSSEPIIREDRRDCEHVVALMVHPDYWRNGIGRDLLDWAFDTLRQGKTTTLNLWTWVSPDGVSTPAQRLYERQGFHATGRYRTHPHIPDPQIEYEVNL